MNIAPNSRTFFSGCPFKVRCLALLLLLAACSAHATAPRITAKFFGDERKADISGYQLAAQDAAAKPDDDAAAELVAEAFKLTDKTPTVDILPSRQLAKYALTNGDVAALIGLPADLSAEENAQYRIAIFFLRLGAAGEKPMALIFHKKDPRANELYKAFGEGLQKLIDSGKYLEILAKHFDKAKLPADYINLLKKQNANLK